MKALATFTLWVVLAACSWSQTKFDTIMNYTTETPVTIDGQATEACWSDASWHAIDQVWIPYNAYMKAGDFEGRFKVSWDQDYLYVLVEVIDDSLSDDYADPFERWWDDDCLEIFIDEDRSMGDHERNCNAFAYHVSLYYDALDLNSSGGGINYRDHVEVEMATIGEHTYLWEMAFNIYDETFSLDNPEASRVTLEADKLMGLAVAYCDNDETYSRENFIGSMYMTESQYNDMYKNADHFGPMVLSASKEDPTGVIRNNQVTGIRVFPIPAQDVLTVVTSPANHTIHSISISTLTGQLVRSESCAGNSHTIHLENLDAGMYILECKSGQKCHTQLVVKQ
jgi:hypothetical protein